MTSPKSQVPAQTLKTLTADLIDYAGLFPPAKLDMAGAVERYARYQHTEHAAMLGRFICPASRLEELSTHAGLLMPGTAGTSGYREMSAAGDPWRISVVADLPIDESLEAINAFDHRHSQEDNGLARVTALEVKISSSAEIDELIEEIPEDLLPFFEVPTDVDVRGMIAAIAGESSQGGAAAKIRCGGVTPDAIPPIEAVAAFIHACSLGGVMFKATAGLHHPVRAEYPLSYEEDAPRGVMHGFLNVFMAAALVRSASLSMADTITLLEETDATTFTFTNESAGWRDRAVSLVNLAKAREAFSLSYGSCSFEEPVDDLRSLGLL